MRKVETVYVDGRFETPIGTAEAPLFNPATEEQTGVLRLGDTADIDRAVAAAKRALPAFAATSVQARIAMLERLSAAVADQGDALAETMREEYGAPPSFVDFSSHRAGTVFLDMARTVRDYDFRFSIRSAEIEMRPVGIAAAIVPWNSVFGAICSKVAAALAAGCPVVVKPSELSGLQVCHLARCLHQADLPPGVVNIVNGLGAVAGAALTAHPDVRKITFTGSTATGRTIMRTAADTMKRVTLELGGKGPAIILDDADLDTVIPQVLAAGFLNSGQACMAGTRILAPAHQIDEILARLEAGIAAFPPGDPHDPAARIGPMVSRKQWDRVQSYIRIGEEEGARLLAGGEGRPQGFDRGWFVRPTIFADVRNEMRIAREEIFGPVLSVLACRGDDHAVAIANDLPYGLQAYVFGRDVARARGVAERIEAGRVVVNNTPHEPLAPFGGVKLSGMGREFGAFGLEAFLEPRAVLI